VLAAACLAALLPAHAHAQDAAPAADFQPLPAAQLTQLTQLAQREVERHMVIGLGSDLVEFGPAELPAEPVVKGAPYCADAQHEIVQWLADGQGGAPNRIVRTQVSRLCRDSEGRTRQEVERGGRKAVYLRDPVSGEQWVLDPERKTARSLQVQRVTRVELRGGERGASAAGSSAAPALPTPPTLPPLPAPPAPAGALPGSLPQPVVVFGDEAGGGRQVQLHVIRRDDGSTTTRRSVTLPPAVQWRADMLAPRGPGTSTPLPARDMDGVRANGERTTWVIEAGKVGNEKPIQIVREVWTAPELMLTLSSRDFDPRSGETSYRLKNLRRGEPDAALMRVPADYQKPAGRPADAAAPPKG
jgi:hypothetical protein